MNADLPLLLAVFHRVPVLLIQPDFFRSFPACPIHCSGREGDGLITGFFGSCSSFVRYVVPHHRLRSSYKRQKEHDGHGLKRAQDGDEISSPSGASSATITNVKDDRLVVEDRRHTKGQTIGKDLCCASKIPNPSNPDHAPLRRSRFMSGTFSGSSSSRSPSSYGAGSIHAAPRPTLSRS